MKSVSNFFSEYSENSSIHGVKYVGERNRHFAEKIFWIVCLITSITGCTFMIGQMYVKWQKSPVIVTSSEKLTSIKEIPFPAITICPLTKTNDLDRAFNLSDVYATIQNGLKKNLSEETIKHFEAAFFACDLKTEYPGLPNIEKVFKQSLVHGDDITYGIFNLMPEVYLHDVMYGSVARKDKGSEILTEEGVCKTLNMINMSKVYSEEINQILLDLESPSSSSINWSSQEGYSTDGVNAYPLRGIAAGYQGGIKFNVKTHKVDRYDSLCSGGDLGYKIILHSPDEIPNVKRNYITVSADQKIVVNIKPRVVRSSKHLKRISPSRRQCYFEGEKKLKFFNLYTQSNCDMECLSNFTLSSCRCVKYFMVRDEHMEICNISNVKCLVESREKYDMQNEKVWNYHENDVDRNKNCNCLPMCNSTFYDSDVSQVKNYFLDMYTTFYHKKGEKGEKNDEEVKKRQETLENTQTTKFEILFSEDHFVSSKKSESYDWKDFISNCGGIVGLFIGTSILSFIEIFYYVTLRLICRRRKNVPANQPEPPEM